ncbi:DUF3368 domain-containing protein [Halapricum desulfuricans]|uniref:DUF3368 domain-containing protein n=1 Tax=Halapricum desulfuricans TaxID=2841257 RepID=UPI001E39679B|nr:DUF3368 domain-containing protein [Halapricum desulfuricans]
MRDETYARDIAAAEGITTRRMAYIVRRLTQQGSIRVKEGRAVIDAMTDEGWYCAPNVYRQSRARTPVVGVVHAIILQKLDSLAEQRLTTNPNTGADYDSHVMRSTTNALRIMA